MKKYTLAALQMAYLPLTMKKETTGEKCLYCWQTAHCDCNADKYSIQNDPFINLTFQTKYE